MGSTEIAGTATRDAEQGGPPGVDLDSRLAQPSSRTKESLATEAGAGPCTKVVAEPCSQEQSCPSGGPDTEEDWGSAPSDPYTTALRTGRGPLFLRRADGWLLPLEVERWCARPDVADRSALERCQGAVLDVGCGPGRLVAALAGHGHRTLGIDVSRTAVDHTVRRGGTALRRSVFDPVPAEGRWGTVLLIDGNIGIGGDPAALLARCAEVLGPRGLLIAETVPVDVDERVEVALDDGSGAPGAAFPWARVGAPALLRHAQEGGWQPREEWTIAGRQFVALRNGRGATGSRRVTGNRRALARARRRPARGD